MNSRTRAMIGAVHVFLFSWCMLPVRMATAQEILTYQVLHSFGDGSVVNDGTQPQAPLVQGSDGNFYGVTSLGGEAHQGTLFEYNPTSKQVTILHSFGDGSIAGDGTNPVGSLIQASDGNFYGMTSTGGALSPGLVDGGGTIFEFNPTTQQTTILHRFGDGSVANDGLFPTSALIQASDGNFYGTTSQGGSTNSGPGAYGYGAIFEFIPSLNQLTILHSFGDGSIVNDAEYPACSLIQASDGSLYGTSPHTVYRYNPTTQQLTVVNVPTSVGQPVASLIQASDGNLYGTSSGNSDGTVFEVNPNSWQVTILHTFPDPTVANDGEEPDGSLIQSSDGNLYGATIQGGSTNTGTLFRLNPLTKQETVVHSFARTSNPPYTDGWSPDTGPIQAADGCLYGLTTAGGAAQSGTLFVLSLGLPAAPTSLTATPGAAQVSLAWATVTGSTSYDVFESTSKGGNAQILIAANIASTGYNVTGLTGGATYYFKVAGVNAAGTGPMSAEVPYARVASPPSGLAATAGNALVTLTWNASPGATSYSVYRGTTSGGESSAVIGAGIASSTYTDSGLSNGDTYYYIVTAVNSGGTSGYSNEAYAAPSLPPASPAAPTGLTATPGSAQVTLRWTPSSRAAGYNVYQGTTAGGEDAAAVATGITSTAYTQTGLSNGITYYYKIAAANSGGTSGYSNEAYATPTAPPPAPSNLTVISGNAQATLSWTPSPGATAYSIYRGTSPGGESAAAIATGVKSVTYTNTGLTNGATFYYEVTAVNVGGKSGFSNEAEAIPVAPPAIPTGLTAIAGSAMAALAWTASSGAVTYNLYRGTSAGGERAAPIATGLLLTHFTDLSLTNGTTYYYVLAAVNPGGTSGYSNEASTSPSSTISPPAAPTNLIATAGSASAALSWTASAKAAAYNLFRGTTSGGELTAAVASGLVLTHYTDVGLTNGVTYYYVVNAVNAEGTSGYSNEVSLKIAVPVASVFFVQSDTTTQGAWKGVYGSDGYDIVNDKSSNNPSFPSYATFDTTASAYTWAATTADVQGLTLAAGGAQNRILSCWYSPTSFSIDCNLTDGRHFVSLYCLDWDTNVSRAETIQVVDAATNEVLDTQTVSGFRNGTWEVWAVRGHVKFVVTDLAGGNCVVSGVFID